jgi:hypothetical protein
LDLSDVKKELEDIDNDVKEWTKDEIDVPYDIPKQYKNSNKIYYKFDDTYDSNCNLICEDEKKKLIKGNFVRCELKESFDRYSNQIEMWLRLSDNENEIHISEEENSKEYDVCSFECETEMRKEFHPYLKRAHPDTIKGWDKRINVVKTKTGNMKSQIDSFRSNGLKHIHTNIFGKTKYVDIIENNLNDIEKQIELLEIEADHICHAYNNIKPSDKNQSVKLIPDE